MYSKMLFKNRNINKKLRRWEHHEGLDPDEPKGCGYPICVDVDMRPKRFKYIDVRKLRDRKVVSSIKRVIIVEPLSSEKKKS